MVEQSGIGLVILFDAFFATFKLNQDIGRRFPFKMAFDGKKRCIMFDDLAIYSVEITLGIGQLMDRVQDVGLANAIGTSNCVNSIAKLQRSLAVVLKVKQLKSLQIHSAK